MDTHHFPVSGHRILAIALLFHSLVAAQRFLNRINTFHCFQVCQTQTP